MTEPTPEDDERDLGPPPAAFPRWVPVLIGVVLVAIAALAVYTGLRYRNSGTMTEHVGVNESARTRQTTAPGGEPGAGASLVLPENTPTANAPVTGDARAVITGGGAGGVQSSIRIWARRGMVLNVLPEDAMVFVNDLPIGYVRQFNTMEEVYDFAEPGSYTVRVVAPDGREKTYVVTATNEARQDVARISARLQE